MSIVRIARHAETTWNAHGRYQGRIDSPLSGLGRAQAAALARALKDKPIGKIVTSPLSRCVETAAPLARALGVPIQTDELLTEIAHGDWEGRYRDEIARNDPARFRAWRERPAEVQFTGGESLRDVAHRWERFVASFEPTVDSLIVTHDVVVRIALLERTGRSLEGLRTMRAHNAAYAEFAVENNCWRLVHASVANHLNGLTADHKRQAL